MTNITVYLDESTKKELRRAAAEHDLTMSKFIERLIITYLKHWNMTNDQRPHEGELV